MNIRQTHRSLSRRLVDRRFRIGRCQPLGARRRLRCEQLEDRRLLSASSPAGEMEVLLTSDDNSNVPPLESGTILGRKWEDANGDGQRNEGERGLAGVTVYSDLNFNGKLDSGEPRAVTMEDDPDTEFNEQGRYRLNDLQPGYHMVREVVPAGYWQTYPSLPPGHVPPPWGDPSVHVVFVEAGATVEGIHFGNQKLEAGSIHGTKWEDLDGDGQRDASERGLGGVTIYSDWNNNAALDPNEPHTVTMEDDPQTDFDEGGMYWLEGLRPGTHTIREVVPDGYHQTFPRASEPGTDPNDNADEQLGLAASYVMFRDSLGSTADLRADHNGNGVVDSSDLHAIQPTTHPDIEFATFDPDSIDVRLTAGEVFTTTVSMTVHPNIFVEIHVDVIAPEADVPFQNLSGVQVNGGGGDTSSFDVMMVGDGQSHEFNIEFVDASTGSRYGVIPVIIRPPGQGGAHVVTLQAGQVVEGINFGNRPTRPGSVHGRKWEDLNGNGRPDNNEPGLAGVTIYSDLNRNGVFDSSEPHAVTMEDIPETDFDEGGLYSLEELRPGHHVIREVVPDGYVQTYPGPIFIADSVEGQPDGALLSFPYPGGGAHRVFVEPGGGVDGVNFGNQPVKPGAVTGLKWEDLNGDGQRSNNESGLPGVTVYADLNFNGVLDENEPHAVTQEDNPSTAVDESGRYRLDNLRPGLHIVREVVPDGYIQTFPSGPVVLPLDPAGIIHPGDGAHVVFVISGGVVERINFGNQPIGFGSIHGVKWEDLDGDGQQDDDEPGLAGVVVYSDRNNNGMLDQHEPRTRTMKDDPETTADETGHYWLELRAGTHIIREVVPDGYRQTFPSAPVPQPRPEDGINAAGSSFAAQYVLFRDTLGSTSDLRADRNADGIVDQLDYEEAMHHNGSRRGAHVIDLRPGDEIRGIDFGNQPLEPGSIHGLKWEDINGNGQRDEGEPGLAGVTIFSDINRNGRLDDHEPRTRTMEDDPETNFDETGIYWLENLRPGQHFIYEVVPDGYQQTFPLNPLADSLLPVPGWHVIDVRPGRAVDGVDFGNKKIEPGSVHGVKWEDLNGNRERDPHEPGLAGVVIYSDLNFNGQLDDNEPHTVTMEDDPETDFDEGGMYWLEDLRPGTHTIREVVPDGYRQTFPVSPFLRPIEEPGWHTVFLGNGETVYGIDFGNMPIEHDSGSVSGLKWNDLNGNGERDPNEPGLAGVTIFSDLNFNGQLDDDEPQAVTIDDPREFFPNDTGKYRLDNLRPGFHLILEVVPDGYEQTYPVSDAVIAIYPPPPSGHYIEVPSGEVVVGIDFGNHKFEPAEVHGVKWEDANGNGRRDEGEPGLAGVRIYSDYNYNGKLDSNEPHAVTMENDPQTFLDETGMYWLDGLRPGLNLIREVVPAGYVQTFPSPVPANANSDAHTVYLQPGGVEDGLNFGNRRVNGTTRAAVQAAASANALPADTAMVGASPTVLGDSETAAAPNDDAVNDLLFARLGEQSPTRSAETSANLHARRGAGREELALLAVDAVWTEQGILEPV